MAQRHLDTLETDIALLQDAMRGVQSPEARASLTKLVAELRGALWLDGPDAGRLASVRTSHPMFAENAADWF